MILDLGEIAVRSFRPDDLAALCRYAGDREVSIQLRDRFPFPYTPEDGEKWLRAAVAQDPETAFAIASPEELIGGIGLELGSDVHLRTAELGYWLGRPFWGHGFATRAVRALSAWAFETFELDRLGACVFENNGTPLSRRDGPWTCCCSGCCGARPLRRLPRFASRGGEQCGLEPSS